MNLSSYSCEPCVDGCMTCDGPTLKDCQSCNTSDDGTLKYYKYIGEDTCSLTCPKGQFIDSTIDFLCQQCSFLCEACKNSANNCVPGEGCPVGYYFYNETNSCLASCPNNYYADMTSGYCEPCDDSCLLCYGSGTTKCTRCRIDPDNSSAIFFKHPRLDACVASCPTSYYGETEDYTCVRCH